MIIPWAIVMNKGQLSLQPDVYQQGTLIIKKKRQNKTKPTTKKKPKHQISAPDELENSIVFSRPNETSLCKRMEFLLVFKMTDLLGD